MGPWALCARPFFPLRIMRRIYCCLNPLASEFICLVHESRSSTSEMHLIKWKVCNTGLVVCSGSLPIPWHFIPSIQVMCRYSGLSLMFLCTQGKPWLHHPSTSCVTSLGSRELLCSCSGPDLPVVVASGARFTPLHLLLGYSR